MEHYKMVFSTIEGWLTAVAVYLGSFLGESSHFLVYLCVMVLADLAFGIIRSLRNGVGLRSGGIFLSCAKLIAYCVLMLLFVLIDKTIDSDSLIATRAVTAVLMAGEIWSIIGNLAIIFPSVTSFALVRKVLASEIAEKTSIDKEELERTLDEEKEEADKQQKNNKEEGQ